MYDFCILSVFQENQPINRNVHWKKAVILFLLWAMHVKGCICDLFCHLYLFLKKKKDSLQTVFKEAIMMTKKHIKIILGSVL